MTDRIPAIDLTRYFKKRELHGLALYQTWLYSEEFNDYEPCLVVVNAVYPHAFRPCVVALSAAYLYNDAHYMARRVGQFIEQLGLQGTPSLAYKIADAFAEHLDDLIKIPPNPVDGVVGADATITVNGKKHQVELLDYVSQRQS